MSKWNNKKINKNNEFIDFNISLRFKSYVSISENVEFLLKCKLAAHSLNSIEFPHGRVSTWIKRFDLFKSFIPSR